MILRLLALIGVVFLVFKAVRLLLPALLSGQVAAEEPSQIDDVMVKDPYCEVYFPKRDGLHVRHKGEDLYFCSAGCRDKFLTEHR